MKTVIEMAREAGICTWLKPPEDVTERLERFAELVRADERNRTWTQEHWTEYERSIVEAEREACAQFLESTQLGSLPEDTALHYARLLKGFAEGIRARSNT